MRGLPTHCDALVNAINPQPACQRAIAQVVSPDASTPQPSCQTPCVCGWTNRFCCYIYTGFGTLPAESHRADQSADYRFMHRPIARLSQFQLQMSRAGLATRKLEGEWSCYMSFDRVSIAVTRISSSARARRPRSDSSRGQLQKYA